MGRSPALCFHGEEKVSKKVALLPTPPPTERSTALKKNKTCLSAYNSQIPRNGREKGDRQVRKRTKDEKWRGENNFELQETLFSPFLSLSETSFSYLSWKPFSHLSCNVSFPLRTQASPNEPAERKEKKSVSPTSRNSPKKKNYLLKSSIKISKTSNCQKMKHYSAVAVHNDV